jgi:hypothetical protein
MTDSSGMAPLAYCLGLEPKPQPAPEHLGIHLWTFSGYARESNPDRADIFAPVSPRPISWQYPPPPPTLNTGN